MDTNFDSTNEFCFFRFNPMRVPRKTSLNRSAQFSAEVLPNEIYFQIFTYLLPKDFIKAFGNLNSRLRALVQSAFIHFRVTEDNVNLLSSIQANQIKSIMLHDCTNLDKIVNYFKANHFIHLQRMHLTFTQLESMRTFLEIISQLNNLKFLSICGSSSIGRRESEAFYQTIAELPFVPPFLTRLQHIEIYIVNMMPYFGYTPRPNPLSALESFSIYSLCFDDLAIILTWMPQIRFLKIIYTFMINETDIQLNEHDRTSKLLMQMSPIVSLQRLQIGICDYVTFKVRFLFLFFYISLIMKYNFSILL